MTTMFARTILTLVIATCARACFFLDFACIAKKDAEAAADHLTGDARIAFEQAMDHLFDEDINPMIDKAQAAVDACADKVAAEVNATADHISVAIKSIIDDAASTATTLAENITKDVEKIIADGSDAVQKVERTFFRDAGKLLNQLNQIVQKGQCMEAGGAKQIQDQIYKLLKELNPWYRLGRCWRKLKHSITQTLEDLSDVELYEYQKECTLMSKITPTTPIEGPGGLLETYAQGQMYAAEYYCIGETAGSPAFQDLFTKEWVWWGVQYNSWNSITRKAAQEVKSTADPPCGSAVECYSQAIQKLNEARKEIDEARQEIKDKADETELSDLKQQIKDKADETELSELKQQIKDKADETELSELKQQLASNMGWCDCMDWGRGSLPRAPCRRDGNMHTNCDDYVCPDGYFLNGISSEDTWSEGGTLPNPIYRAVDTYKCCRPCFKTSSGANFEAPKMMVV